MKKMSIAEIEKQEAKLRKQKEALEEAEMQRVHLPYLKTLIGTFWKYPKNSYSCPSKASDYWTTYRQIIDLIETKEGSLCFIYTEIQVDADGKTSIIVDKQYAYTYRAWWGKQQFSGWVKITEKEYMRATKKVDEEMKTQKKLRKTIHDD